MLQIDGRIDYAVLDDMGEEELATAWELFDWYADRREQAHREAIAEAERQRGG
ncbi:MAG TPA: hypothetical protein VHO25_05795 [Polyangiaceae bacterium]|nr:hypothetical protein [Polyangiaceae bacterium]